MKTKTIILTGLLILGLVGQSAMAKNPPKKPALNSATPKVVKKHK